MEKSERQKCIDDPVYFYENYFLVNRKKPASLNEKEKNLLRNLTAVKTHRSGSAIWDTISDKYRTLFYKVINSDLDKYFPKELMSKKLKIKPEHAESLKEIFNHDTLYKVYTERERKKSKWRREYFDEVE